MHNKTYTYKCEICERKYDSPDKVTVIESQYFCHRCLFNIARDNHRSLINRAIVKWVLETDAPENLDY